MKALPVACTTALTAALLSFTATPAQADTPGCATRAEFHKVSHGMAKERVTHIFDTNGRLTSYSAYGGHKYTSRDYNPCAKYAYVTVNYKDGRVQSKSAYWA